MISITATGFIGEKPQLVMVGQSAQKCEFDVIWARRAKSGGEWKTHWERATFVAWGEEAEHLASILEKGNTVSITGLQETSEWVDKASQQKRSKVKFALTAWIKHPAPRPPQHDGEQQPLHQQRTQPPARPSPGVPTHNTYAAARNGEPSRQVPAQNAPQTHHPLDDGGHFDEQSGYERRNHDARPSGFGSPDFIEM